MLTDGISWLVAVPCLDDAGTGEPRQVDIFLAGGCNPVLAWLQVAGELWLADGYGLLAGLLIGSAW